MASIKAILKINEQGNGVITNVTSNVATNNVSALPYTTDLTEWFLNQTSENRNYEGAIVSNGIYGLVNYGTSVYGVGNKVGNRIIYTETYNGLMFGYPTLQNGVNYYNFILRITGTDILLFNIWFDNAEGQYPLEYSVYNSISGTTTTYSNDDNIIEISGLPSGYGTTIITINRWAVANKPVAIKFFENVEIDIEMNKYWIREFETQTQRTSDASSIEYGVLANTGSITLIDKDNTLYEKSQLGYLNVNLFSLELYLNNKLTQEHVSTQNPYYSSDKNLKLDLSNEVQNWNNITFAQTTYSNTTLYNLLSIFLNKIKTYTTVEINTMLNEYCVDYENAQTTIESILKNFNVSSFTLESASVLQQINKICAAAQLQCVIKDNGTIKFYSARPLKYTNEKVIVIPFEKQYETFNYSILVDNRYDSVVFDDTTSASERKNSAKIETNEIMRNAYALVYDEEEQQIPLHSKKYLEDSILSDYTNGIRKGETSIFPCDLYYTDGTIAKTWKNGEIIEINDIVKIEREVKNEYGEIEVKNALYDKNGLDVYFRVVDRKVRYEGQILIELVLQEIKN